jgi:GT2 family glycosyltransferase
VVVVSHNSARWLPACLESVIEAAGEIELDLVVVDSGSRDETAALVEEHAVARLVTCENRGFGHANNRGVATTDTEWVLYLNPDTLVVAGTIEEWVKSVADSPDGVFGARQLDEKGAVEPSIRRFPRPARWLGEALASERWPARPGWSGERVLDPAAYDQPRPCDWVSGAVMLVRREVLDAVGGFDERFFLYCEEPDLSWRAAAAGWGTRYAPALTVVHYGGNESATPELAAQLAYARRQYMGKHFTPLARAGGVAALTLGYGLRSLVGPRPRRRASRAALTTLIGLRSSPFE